MSFTQGGPDCVPAPVPAQPWFLLGIGGTDLTAGSEVCREPQSVPGDGVQPGRPALNLRDSVPVQHWFITGNQKDMLTAGNEMPPQPGAVLRAGWCSSPWETLAESPCCSLSHFLLGIGNMAIIAGREDSGAVGHAGKCRSSCGESGRASKPQSDVRIRDILI